MLVEQINRCIALSICVIIIKESWGDVELHIGRADQQVRCAEYHKGVKRLPVWELLPAQLSKPDWAGMFYRGVRWGKKERGLHVWASWRKWILCTHTSWKRLRHLSRKNRLPYIFEFVLTTCCLDSWLHLIRITVNKTTCYLNSWLHLIKITVNNNNLWIWNKKRNEIY